MSREIQILKEKLKLAISQLCSTSWMFVKNPNRDFTRERKLPLHEVISILLCMEGGSLTGELLRYFGCSQHTASGSAFIQQRQKINEFAFPSLFDLFVRKTDKDKLYKGYRLLAADGTDIQIPTDIKQPDSFFPGANGQTTGIISGLDLPDMDEFDMYCPIQITRRKNVTTKPLLLDKNRYKWIGPSSPFDYLPTGVYKNDPVVFYPLPFRVVRFKISDSAYETVITNLDAAEFPPEELKYLYGMRWGIETSFRELKYTVGLLHFHAKRWRTLRKRFLPD